MSRTLLIVESDPAVVESVRDHLSLRGFSIQQVQDGKGCMELLRRQPPAAVVLAVELPAGQNGYLICREIKKDDDLKTIPIIILGNPDKFAEHRKLRTHADAYVAKPLEMPELLAELNELIGPLPEPGDVTGTGEETLNMSDLLGEPTDAAEEIAVEADDSSESDSDLALLDSALSEVSVEEPVVLEDDTLPPPDPSHEGLLGGADETDDLLSALGGPSEASSIEPATEATDAELSEDDVAELVVEEEAPVAEMAALEEPAAFDEPAPPPPVPLRTGPSADAAELRSLRARNGELQDELERAETRASEAEERIAALESELAGKSAEVEASRQTGKGDKDYFALREAANKKDKEILRLKGEVNEKEQSELEMREREVQLEQKMAEQGAEMGRKDAQLKALTSRADALLAEKKRAESQSQSAREEARTAQERAATAEEQARMATDRTELLETELAESRSGRAQAEDSLQTTRAEAEEAKGRLAGLQHELDEARTQLMEQTTAFAEEGANLRSRVAELEGQLTKHEERITKLYARIKGDEKLRDRVKKALNIAAQLLDEPAGALSEDNDGSPAGDEPRAA